MYILTHSSTHSFTHVHYNCVSIVTLCHADLFVAVGVTLFSSVLFWASTMKPNLKRRVWGANLYLSASSWYSTGLKEMSLRFPVTPLLFATLSKSMAMWTIAACLVLWVSGRSRTSQFCVCIVINHLLHVASGSLQEVCLSAPLRHWIF